MDSEDLAAFDFLVGAMAVGFSGFSFPELRGLEVVGSGEGDNDHSAC